MEALFVFELWSHYEAQAGFEPAVILPQSLECWDCWRASPYSSCPSIGLLKRVRRLEEMESLSISSFQVFKRGHSGKGVS